MVVGQKRELPPLFEMAVETLLTMPWRAELTVEEIPAPAKIAPFAVAVSAEIASSGQELGSGRLVLLHDPAGNPSWDGQFRCVSFCRATAEPEMVTDPLLPEVGWSWLGESMDHHHAGYRAPSGTVTAVASRSFGGISDEPARAEVELRVSWTPLIADRADLTAHLLGWGELLCLAAGLPPVPDGVVPIQRRRAGSRRS